MSDLDNLIFIWSHPDLATLILIWSHPDLVTLIFGQNTTRNLSSFSSATFPWEPMEEGALSLCSSVLFATSSTFGRVEVESGHSFEMVGP